MEDYILLIKTVQIAPFRILMTALKDILLETNITFQKDGIKIINMDKSHTILVHLHLQSENFEYYECKKEKIIIGANMFHLFKAKSLISILTKLTECKYRFGLTGTLDGTQTHRLVLLVGNFFIS